jgi:NAD-dependent SIR2 family protein deacetylase
MSVQSGVPVFRNADGTMHPDFLGFLDKYNAARRAHNLEEAHDWFDFSVPSMFRKETEKEAWAYWRWRMLRALVTPAEDYRLLGLITRYFGDDKTFVVTSNCDMLHVLSGALPKRVEEIHGCLGRLQCSAYCNEELTLVDEDFLNRLRNDANWVPRCPHCNDACLRPNVMIFRDDMLVCSELEAQRHRRSAFEAQGDAERMVVLEIGAGVVVPSIRMMAESTGAAAAGLIRVNPSADECARCSVRGIGDKYTPLVMRSTEALQALCTELGLAKEEEGEEKEEKEEEKDEAVVVAGEKK